MVQPLKQTSASFAAYISLAQGYIKFIAIIIIHFNRSNSDEDVFPTTIVTGLYWSIYNCPLAAEINNLSYSNLSYQRWEYHIVWN